MPGLSMRGYGKCGPSPSLISERPPDAFATFGPDASPFQVRRLAKCGRCGERSRIGATVSHDEGAAAVQR